MQRPPQRIPAGRGFPASEGCPAERTKPGEGGEAAEGDGGHGPPVEAEGRARDVRGEEALRVVAEAQLPEGVVPEREEDAACQGRDEGERGRGGEGPWDPSPPNCAGIRTRGGSPRGKK